MFHVWGQEGNLRGKDNLEDLGIDGRVLLKWVFEKWDGRAWAELIWFRLWTDG
jgi:hypothetical protein